MTCGYLLELFNCERLNMNVIG